MAFLIGLLPITISMLILVPGISSIASVYNASDMACRKQVLRHQMEQSQYLDNLLKLNPRARQLHRRLQLAVADVALGIPGSQVRLMKVLSQSKSHALKQKTILQSSRLHRQQSKAFSESHYRRALRSVANLQRHSFSGRTGGLPVKARPPFALTPTYVAPLNFTQQQKVKVTWATRPSHWLTDLLRPLFQQVDLVAFISGPVRGQCSASLRKVNGRWRPRLVST